MVREAAGVGCPQMPHQVSDGDQLICFECKEPFVVAKAKRAHGISLDAGIIPAHAPMFGEQGSALIRLEQIPLVGARVWIDADEVAWMTSFEERRPMRDIEFGRTHDSDRAPPPSEHRPKPSALEGRKGILELAEIGGNQPEKDVGFRPKSRHVVGPTKRRSPGKAIARLPRKFCRSRDLATRFNSSCAVCRVADVGDGRSLTTDSYSHGRSQARAMPTKVLAAMNQMIRKCARRRFAVAGGVR